MGQNAIIEVLEGPKKDKIEVMFNPEDYTESRKVELSGEGVNKQFKVVTMPRFTVNLFYDTYEREGSDTERDVRKETDKIFSLLMPTAEGKKRSKPPMCRFAWGGFTYDGMISSITQKFIMFLRSGIPVRAELTVTFDSTITKEIYERLKGARCRKLWTVKSGDRLDLIAYNTLKDQTQWRKIATANMIINPLLFPTEDDLGRGLIIPD